MLWLWCRLAAVASIRSVAWELPYAAGAALKKQEQKKKERERERERERDVTDTGLGMKSMSVGLYSTKWGKMTV